MLTNQQADASKLYSSLIAEVRRRIHVVDLATTNRIPVEPPFVKEICFLQFRMKRELLALGCLVAHGDIRPSKRLDKAYKADEIISHLERLHPNFYPVAITKTILQDSVDIKVRNKHPLPKSDLLYIYHKCDNFLHKESVNKLFSNNIPNQTSYSDITSIAQRFRDLISNHIIYNIYGELVFICEVFAISDGQERVNVGLCARPSLRQS